MKLVALLRKIRVWHYIWAKSSVLIKYFKHRWCAHFTLPAEITLCCMLVLYCWLYIDWWSDLLQHNPWTFFSKVVYINQRQKQSRKSILPLRSMMQCALRTKCSTIGHSCLLLLKRFVTCIWSHLLFPLVSFLNSMWMLKRFVTSVFDPTWSPQLSFLNIIVSA